MIPEAANFKKKIRFTLIVSLEGSSSNFFEPLEMADHHSRAHDRANSLLHSWKAEKLTGAPQNSVRALPLKGAQYLQMLVPKGPSPLAWTSEGHRVYLNYIHLNIFVF